MILLHSTPVISFPENGETCSQHPQAQTETLDKYIRGALLVETCLRTYIECWEQHNSEAHDIPEGHTHTHGKSQISTKITR